MTRTNCDLFTHNQSRSYLNHLVKTKPTKNRNNQPHPSLSCKYEKTLYCQVVTVFTVCMRAHACVMYICTSYTHTYINSSGSYPNVTFCISNVKYDSPATTVMVHFHHVVSDMLLTWQTLPLPQ
jgi:hypothetical protein